MRYSFPQIHALGGDVLGRAVRLGTISKDQRFIWLPNDFDWAGHEVKPVSSVPIPTHDHPKPAPPKPPAITPVIVEPTLVELATNFEAAIDKWARAGLPIVTKEQYAARATACDGCPFWDGLARFGMGKCLKCGCTRFKRWMATERCPINKWPPLSK